MCSDFVVEFDRVRGCELVRSLVAVTVPLAAPEIDLVDEDVTRRVLLRVAELDHDAVI